MSMGSAPTENRRCTVAVILAGGRGTRLRSVMPDVPKPLIPILGRPFIDFLIDYVTAQGVAEIILATGYRGDQVEAHCRRMSRTDIPIRCIREETALGTGGAIGFVRSLAELRDPFLVMNGDSIAFFDLRQLQRALAAGADAAMVGVRIPNSSRFGRLAVGASGLLEGFLEKTGEELPATINAGIYLIQPSLLPEFSSGQSSSLERGLFPRWLREGKRIAVLAGDGPFIDIGTPESLAEAPGFLQGCGLFPALSY